MCRLCAAVWWQRCSPIMNVLMIDQGLHVQLNLFAVGPVFQETLLLDLGGECAGEAHMQIADISMGITLLQSQIYFCVQVWCVILGRSTVISVLDLVLFKTGYNHGER
jgi:hypothetical protein